MQFVDFQLFNFSSLYISKLRRKYLVLSFCCSFLKEGRWIEFNVNIEIFTIFSSSLKSEAALISSPEFSYKNYFPDLH